MKIRDFGVVVILMLLSTQVEANVFWGKSFQKNAAVSNDMRAVNSRLSEAQIHQFGLQEEIQYLRSLSLEDRIRRVHSITRQIIREVNDPHEHWQTPAETLKRRAGDCEDFAILRIELLRWAGVPTDSMAVFTGWSYQTGHAIAAVDTGHGTWTLDNLRRSAYVSESPRSFRPILGVSPKGVWYFALD